MVKFPAFATNINANFTTENSRITMSINNIVTMPSFIDVLNVFDTKLMIIL